VLLLPAGSTHPRMGQKNLPANTGGLLVGDTGIEPVTPTVSTFSGGRWRRWLATNRPSLLTSARLLRWLSGAILDCGVARLLHAAQSCQDHQQKALAGQGLARWPGEWLRSIYGAPFRHTASGTLDPWSLIS
jgi:hypothetical protein